MSVPQGGMSVPQGGMSVPHTYNNIKIQLDNIKNKNKNNNNITENLDFVEGIDNEVKSVVSNTSTNTPTGGDNIYSNEVEDYLNSLLRKEVEETLEEKIEKVKKVKTKSSIKEDEFDIPQRNIEDKFSDYEIYNALNY
jgi:predicted metal-dependent hydrolase